MTTTPSKTEVIPLEHPELVAAKLQMLLENFGPVCNDKEARHIVKLAIRALDQPAADTKAVMANTEAGIMADFEDRLNAILNASSAIQKDGVLPFCEARTAIRAFVQHLASRASPSQPAERADLIDILEEIYSQYDGGTDCYEYGSGEQGAYIGVAIKISDESESKIIALLNAERPREPGDEQGLSAAGAEGKSNAR